MCYVVLRQLLIVVFIFTVKGAGLTKFVDFTRYNCVPECQVPQERSIVLTQELKVETTLTVPYMIILHRCDQGSGCCHHGEVCKVADLELLNITIFIKNDQTGKFKKKFFEITNHTLCSCQKVGDTIK